LTGLGGGRLKTETIRQDGRRVHGFLPGGGGVEPEYKREGKPAREGQVYSRERALEVVVESVAYLGWHNDIECRKRSPDLEIEDRNRLGQEDRARCWAVGVSGKKWWEPLGLRDLQKNSGDFQLRFSPESNTTWGGASSGV